MIYAFNFTGSRDKELSNLMLTTLKKYCHTLGGYTVIDTDGMGYGNGAGWEPCMMTLAAMRGLLKQAQPKDDDFILSVDSDVVFCNPEVFDHVKSDYGIIGIGHQGEKMNTFIGRLNQFSGCAIFIRVDIARKIANLLPDKLTTVRANFKMYTIPEQEDVVLSYLSQMVGAVPYCLPTHLHSGNFEHDLKENKLSSFYHLNYLPGTFLGKECPGKWDIPRVLRDEGITL